MLSTELVEHPLPGNQRFNAAQAFYSHPGAIIDPLQPLLALGVGVGCQGNGSIAEVRMREGDDVLLLFGGFGGSCAAA